MVSISWESGQSNDLSNHTAFECIRSSFSGYPVSMYCYSRCVYSDRRSRIRVVWCDPGQRLWICISTKASFTESLDVPMLKKGIWKNVHIKVKDWLGDLDMWSYILLCFISTTSTSGVIKTKPFQRVQANTLPSWEQNYTVPLLRLQNHELCLAIFDWKNRLLYRYMVYLFHNWSCENTCKLGCCQWLLCFFLPLRPRLFGWFPLRLCTSPKI